MAKQINSSIPFPQDNYLIRLTKPSFGLSKSSDNPMITIESEVVGPETVTINGEDYIVAGAKVRPLYLVTGKKTPEDTEKAQSMVKEMLAKCELSEFSDWENPDVSVFDGLVVWALLTAEKVERRKAPTQEQLDKGEKQGDVICNPLTGEPEVMYFPKISKIYGKAPADVAAKATGNKAF